LFSCVNKNEKSKKANETETNVTSYQDTLKKNISTINSKKDSLINVAKIGKARIEAGYYKAHFDFNDFSNEGGEGYAYYDIHTKRIKKANITLFGEREQTKIQFTFSDDLINVKETTYRYKVSIAEVKSDKDMVKGKQTIYSIDFNGSPIGNVDKERLDIFQEFKKIVPFELK
jgi:5-hydroxyisourate hydrolase-like protein (transthyretin family)